MVRKIAMEWSLHLITGLIVMPILLGTYWLLWPYKPLRETAAPELFTPAVRVGDTMLIRRQFCVDISVPSQATRQLVSDARIKISLPQVSQSSAVGCHDRIYPIEIPAGIVPGRYWYETTLAYEVNPLRTVHVRLQPVVVEVVQ